MPPTSSTPGSASISHPNVGVDPAPRERRLRGARVHDRVGVLCTDRTGRRPDQPVEQAPEKHQQNRDERDDHRGGREAAGPTSQFLQGEIHTPTPAPVVASIGSMRKTRRAATNELATPSVSNSTDQKMTAPVSNRSEIPPSSACDSG